MLPIDRLINESIHSPCDEAAPHLEGLDSVLMEMKGNHDKQTLLSIKFLKVKLKQIEDKIINDPDINSQALSIDMAKGRDAFLRAVFYLGGEK